jgi:DNA-binding transcriptional ArsR family regulator
MKKQSKNSKRQPAGAEKFSKVSKFLKIVSDENRMKILLVLKGGSLNVTQIHTKLKLPQNLTSHHISKLKSVGLLSEKHEGTFRHYSVNTKTLREHSRIFKELFGI